MQSWYIRYETEDDNYKTEKVHGGREVGRGRRERGEGEWRDGREGGGRE